MPLLNSFPSCYTPTLPDVVPGRFATANYQGVGGDYTCTFAGGPPGQTAYVIALVYTDNGAVPPIITGGVNPWTNIGGDEYGLRLGYMHKCTSLEPSSYTVKYNGDDKNDNSGVLMMELVGMDPVNPGDLIAVGNSDGNVPQLACNGRGILVQGLILTATIPGGGLPSYYKTPPPGYTKNADFFIPRPVAYAYAAFATKPVAIGRTEPTSAWVDPDPTPNNATTFSIFMRAALQP